MVADWTAKAGDTGPAFTQQLNYSDGSIVDLTGASVRLAMRPAAATTAKTITGTTTSATPASGVVTYTPTVADTSTPGTFMGNWIVTFAGGQVRSWPTEGYLTLVIEESLTGTNQAELVTLVDVKDYLDIDRNDRDHDAKLEALIADMRPVIERITGPIIPTVYVGEKYRGGSSIISLSHRPSVGYGTSPVLNVMAVSEYVGSTEYPLVDVADAALGTIYSFEVNVREGTITRRTAGGGVGGFPGGENAVSVTYQSGQSSVPGNVRRATLEAVRVNYQTTQAVGRGRRTVADETDTGPPLGFFLPRRALELLGPTRRAPSIA